MLQLRAAHLHGLHDDGGGRRALPGVRARGRLGRGAGVRRLGARAGADTVFATTALVALNVLFYLAEVAQAGGLQDADLSSLVSDGAIYGPAIADGEW